MHEVPWKKSRKVDGILGHICVFPSVPPPLSSSLAIFHASWAEQLDPSWERGFFPVFGCSQPLLYSACCLSGNAIMGLWFNDLHGSACCTMGLRREGNQRREGEGMSHPLLSRSKCLLVAAVLYFYCCTLMH